MELVPNNNNGFIKFLIVAVVLGIGVTVLFLSVSRAGLESTQDENDKDALRKKEIVVRLVNRNYETEEYIYKIPETGMLPNSPFYGFKVLRNNIWVQLTNNPIEKSKLVLLLADKKIAEAEILFKDNQTKTAIEAGMEALDKLKYADKLIEETVSNDQATQLKAQIFSAGIAYGEIINRAKDSFDLDTEKFGQLVEEINSWNAIQKEEKEQSEY